METTKMKDQKPKRKHRKHSMSSRRGHEGDSRKGADVTYTSAPTTGTSHETLPLTNLEKADGLEATSKDGTTASPMKSSASMKLKSEAQEYATEHSPTKTDTMRRLTISGKSHDAKEPAAGPSRKESATPLFSPVTEILKESEPQLLEASAVGKAASPSSVPERETSAKTAQSPENHDKGAEAKSDMGTLPQEKLLSDYTDVKPKDDLPAPEEPQSPGEGRKNVVVSTEMRLSETTVELDVNPYVRYPLVTLNICFWLFGFMLIMAGLYAYIDTWNQSQYSAFSSTNNIYSVIMVRVEITVMLLGATLLSLSFCGCVGALRENTRLLNTHSHFITAPPPVNPAMGLPVFFPPTQFKRLLRPTLTQNPVIHHRDNPDFQQLIDTIQEYLRCCGVSERAFRDWNENIYFNCSRSNPSRERCSVPYS